MSKYDGMSESKEEAKAYLEDLKEKASLGMQLLEEFLGEELVEGISVTSLYKLSLEVAVVDQLWCAHVSVMSQLMVDTIGLGNAPMWALRARTQGAKGLCTLSLILAVSYAEGVKAGREELKVDAKKTLWRDPSIAASVLLGLVRPGPVDAEDEYGSEEQAS